MVTMQEVANKAGVSRAAVSLVLKDKSNATRNARIPDITRQRILETVEEMGYRTNRLARSIVMGKSQMIGYLVSEPHYEPHWNTILGALSETENSDFTLKVLSVTDDTFEERIRQCVEMRLSGLIVRVVTDKSLLFHEAERARIPVITVDEGTEQPFGVRVAADDAPGIRAALEHLISLGHRRIGFISSDFPKFYVGEGDSGSSFKRCGSAG